MAKINEMGVGLDFEQSSTGKANYFGGMESFSLDQPGNTDCIVSGQTGKAESAKEIQGFCPDMPSSTHSVPGQTGKADPFEDTPELVEVSVSDFSPGSNDFCVKFSDQEKLDAEAAAKEAKQQLRKLKAARAKAKAEARAKARAEAKAAKAAEAKAKAEARAKARAEAKAAREAKAAAKAEAKAAREAKAAEEEEKARKVKAAVLIQAALRGHLARESLKAAAAKAEAEFDARAKATFAGLEVTEAAKEAAKATAKAAAKAEALEATVKILENLQTMVAETEAAAAKAATSSVEQIAKVKILGGLQAMVAEAEAKAEAAKAEAAKAEEEAEAAKAEAISCGAGFFQKTWCSAFPSSFKASLLGLSDELLRSLRKNAAVSIQAAFRGHLARKAFARKATAAVLIQAAFRGHLARKAEEEAEAAKAEAISCGAGFFEQTWCSKNKAFPSSCKVSLLGLSDELLRSLRNNAAVLIQAAFRRHLARKAFARKATAAVLIQAAFRGHLARKAFARKATAAVIIQAAFRGHLARKAGVETEDSVLKSTMDKMYDIVDKNRDLGSEGRTHSFIQRIDEKERPPNRALTQATMGAYTVHRVPVTGDSGQPYTEAWEEYSNASKQLPGGMTNTLAAVMAFLRQYIPGLEEGTLDFSEDKTRNLVFDFLEKAGNSDFPERVIGYLADLFATGSRVHIVEHHFSPRKTVSFAKTSEVRDYDKASWEFMMAPVQKALKVDGDPRPRRRRKHHS